MVEGPKVVLKVQRIQCLKGQCLQAMIVAPSMNSSQPLTTVMQKCIGMFVHRVWCLGKELFITMAQNEIGGTDIIASGVIGIRLHFGMAGSERLIQTNTLLPGYQLQNLRIVASSMLPKHSRKKWDACLIFNNQSLFVYDSSVSTRTSHYLENAYNSLELDVMSYDKFSIDSIIRQIRASDQSRRIHEVIMDQLIFPGVGNVIKIEGLFDAAMHPHCVTSEIDDVWLRCLVRKLRDYARYWYDCCKGPGASKPNRKNVYGRQNCGVCGSVICLIRDGVLQRITYLCSKCQVFPAQHRHQESLKNQSGEKFFAPGRSTICLEVRKPDEEQKDDICVKASWTCLYCTLDNLPDLMTCEICNTVRHTASVPRAVESSSSCAYSESNMSVVRTPFHSADKSDGSQGDTVPSACPDGTRASLGKLINDENINNNVRPQPKVDAAVSAVGDGDGTGHSFLQQMMCKCLKQGGLNRVRKSGPTNSRLFWSCSGRKCDFFSWADGTFPKCQHGAPCTVRRVLKPGPTNGQYFFSCSQETKCNYFLWSNKHVPLRPAHVPYPDVTHCNGKRHLGAQSESNTGKKYKHITIPL